MNQPMKVTSVLSRAFTTWFDHFVGFFVLALVLSLPLIPLELMPAMLGQEQAAGLAGGLVASIFRLIVGYLLTGVVVLAVFQSLKGDSQPLVESLKDIAPRLPSIIGAAILVGIIVFVGFIACIIPGIYLWLMLAVVVPVIVIEKVGIGEALSRSKDLTEGQKFRIFGIYFLYGLMAAGVAFFTVGCLSTFAGNPEDLMAQDAGVGTVGVALVVDHVGDAILMPLQATVTTVIYHDLRQINDGLNVDEMFPTPTGPAGGGAPEGGFDTDSPESDAQQWDDVDDGIQSDDGLQSDDGPDGADGETDDSWGQTPSDDDKPAW